jgi:hypothetical protein
MRTYKGSDSAFLFFSVGQDFSGDTHEEAVSHLPKIHRSSRIKVHLRVDFYLKQSADGNPRNKWGHMTALLVPFTLGRGCMTIISSLARERTE